MIRKKIEVLKRENRKKQIMAMVFCLIVILFIWSMIHSNFDIPYQYPEWTDDSEVPDQEIIDYYKDYNIVDEKAKLKEEYESLIQTPI